MRCVHKRHIAGLHKGHQLMKFLTIRRICSIKFCEVPFPKFCKTRWFMAKPLSKRI